MAGRRAAAGLILAALLLSGCASREPWPQSSSSLDDSPVVVAGVPFYPQQQYQCGPAALAMMLNSQGLEVDPQALVDRVYLPGRQGTLQVEMIAAARQFGLLVYPLEPELASVLAELRAGHPVLILQNLRYAWWPQWHYAVVIGYDAEHQELILHSGVNANYRQPLPAFMATWERAERWALTILPPRQVPATATPLGFLASAHDLEVTNQLEAAAIAYRTAYERWPDQPAGYLGAGNVAFRQQQWQDALGHYQALTQRFPQLAAGWNNLAEVLLKLDCPQSASLAGQCAARLNPQRFAAPEDLGGDTNHPQCLPVSCPASAP